MKKKLMRKGSKGIDGTYANIDHHAKGVFEIVTILENAIESYKGEIDEWIQGHNIHIIKTHDGREFAFRPFRSSQNSGIDGVEVLMHLSRKNEVRICVITEVAEAHLFATSLCTMLASGKNTYGVSDENKEL